jgi:hypothetical protein
MKRLLKLLARLYPSAWRNRYATEYEALLDDATPRPQDAFNILWGAFKMQLTSWTFTRIVLPSCVAGLLAAIAVSFTVPPRFVAKTVVSITAIDKSKTADMIARANNAVQIDEIQRDHPTLNKKWLAVGISAYNLYPRERASMPPDAVINKMMKDIDIRLVPRGNGDASTIDCIISFKYSDPKLAQSVDRDLAGRFWQAMVSTRTDSIPTYPLPSIVRFGIKWPDLPQKPFFPRRILFGIYGLLTGLGAGLTLAAILEPRRVPTVSNS